VPDAKRRRALRRRQSVIVTAAAIAGLVVIALLLLYKMSRQVSEAELEPKHEEAPVATVPRAAASGPVIVTPTLALERSGPGSEPPSVASAPPPPSPTLRAKATAAPDIIRKPAF
jgi:hypothetical protein